MTAADRLNPENRLLVLATTSKDAALTQSILSRAGVDSLCCENLEQICAQLDSGASAVMLVEEAVTAGRGNCLSDWLARQPPWSDLPVLVLARPGADSAAVAQAMDLLGNVTVLERPTRVAALVSAVRSALRARQRQYEARAHLSQIECSERDLSDFFDNASVGLNWVGADGIILRVNQTELDMLGYARDEYVGRHIAEFHANLPVIHDILARLARGETLRDFPARMRAKDGSIRDVLINSNVLFQDGVFVHTRCFTRDITEQKRAEQQLIDSEERFRLAQSVSRIGTFDWNIQAGVNIWTPELEAIYGLAPGQFPKTQATWESLVHPDDLPAAMAKVNAAIRTGEPTEGEWRVLWPDASVHWVAGRFKCFQDSAGTPLRLSGINIDITERKLTELQLRETQAQLQLELTDTKLLQSISAQMIHLENAEALYDKILDAAVAIMRSEYASMQMLYPERGAGGELRLLAFRGFNPEAAKFWEWVRADSESTCGAALRTRERAIATDVEKCDYMAGTEDLATYIQTGIHAVQTTPLFSRSGALVGMISTHWKQPHQPSERDLRLLDILARQAADLIERKSAEQALREADRRKDEFLAVLAHELRNPLAPIRNSLHILRMTSQHDPAAQRVGEMMERQVNHMVRLVDDLLEVSRITRGKIELRKEPVEIAPIVRSAVEASAPLIESAGHQLALTIPPEPLTVEGDPVRLAQVIANLLNNAAKYTDAGGQIWLTARQEGQQIAISVRDNGAGIPSEMLPRVFDLFTQVDRHVDRAQGGLGIGLTLVKSLVEMHGGTVQARSEGPGRGSEFVVRLPLTIAPRPAVIPGKPLKRSTVLASRRVLVVDDNRDAADSLGLLLKFLGADVHIVCSGPDAFQALETFQPSTVLLDIGMPGMDGYEVARRIRLDARHRGVTLIALTGWGQEEDRRRSQDAGFDHHLIKPAELTALQTLLVSLEDGPESHQLQKPR